jgi:hypothetical protein
LHRESPQWGELGATPKNTAPNGYHQSSGDYRHQAPTLAERRDDKLIAELTAAGYCIAVSCTVCGHPLTNAQSVALMVGPKCRAKAVNE